MKQQQIRIWSMLTSLMWTTLLVRAASAQETPYQECLIDERVEQDHGEHTLEFWGGLHLWKGSAVPFICDEQNGRVKASAKQQLAQLIGRFELARADLSPDAGYDLPATCNLFAEKKAALALTQLAQPSPFPIQSFTVDEVGGSAKFFLECFVATEPNVRGFPAADQ